MSCVFMCASVEEIHKLISFSLKINTSSLYHPLLLLLQVRLTLRHKDKIVGQFGKGGSDIQSGPWASR